MNLQGRAKRVKFIEEKLFRAYNELKTGRSEEQRLAGELDHAISELKQDSFCGIRIPRPLWPREYVRTYHITNLWKYDLPRGWRLIYTLEGNEVEIISIILEWFNHKDYEKKFHYKVR